MRPTSRAYHTPAGWWLMTHERGSAVAIGGAAFAVLAGDLLYATSRWRGTFPASFLIGLAGLLGLGIVAVALRLGRPVGADRLAARRRQRTTNGVFIVLLAVLLTVNNVFGRNAAGEILGLLAGLAAGFAAFCVVSLVRPR